MHCVVAAAVLLEVRVGTTVCICRPNSDFMTNNCLYIQREVALFSSDRAVRQTNASELNDSLS